MSGPKKSPVLVVGVGPGLGLSIARRFGREGHPVALLSRNAHRHDSYLAELREEGIEGLAVTADVRDTVKMRAALESVTERLGPVGVVYYGPGAADPTARPVPIPQTGVQDLRAAMGYYVDPALELVPMVLPGMLERGSGTILFATGLAAVIPMPGLGALALASAALRNYALTLNEALASSGVYVGALVLGGLIRGGDIHRLALAGSADENGFPILDPDAIAETAWTLTVERHRPEATFNALTSMTA